MKTDKHMRNLCFIKGHLLPALFILITIADFVQAQEQNFFKRIHTEKKLKVGIIKEELFPFYFYKDNRWQGSDIDLALEVAKALNATAEFNANFVNHRQILQALNEGQIDFAIGHLKQDLSEGLEIRYSKPYLNLNYALLTNRLNLARLHIPDLEIETLRDKAFTIGSLDTPRYKELINRFFPKAKLELCANRTELLNSLLAGKYDAAFGDEAELSNYFRNQSGLGLQLQYWPLATLQDELVIYLSWKNKRFIDWINIFLEPKANRFTFSSLCQTRNQQEITRR